MKKIVASAGLLALGASGLYAQTHYQPGLENTPAKPWGVGVSLRGFYDDNYNSVTGHGTNRVGSFGAEINPNASFKWGNDQTTINLAYSYALKWYDHPLSTTFVSGTNVTKVSETRYDQQHVFLASLSHTFNERYSMGMSDSFAIGQEPDVLRAPDFNPDATIQRLPGNNIRNSASISFNAQVTPLFGLAAGYGNTVYFYDQSGAQFFSTNSLPGGKPDPSGAQFVGVPIGTNDVFLGPSTAGTLDRMDQTWHLDARWTVQPETVALIGYQFELVNYTAGEPIGVTISTNTGKSTVAYSNIRDSRSHFVYAGVEHVFRPNFSGTLQAGAQYSQYPNDPHQVTSFGPYAKGSLDYLYAPESHLEVGFTHQKSVTDQVGDTTDPVRDTETSVLFVHVYHRLIPRRLYVDASGTFQNSTFQGGGKGFDGKSERDYLLGLEFDYFFNPYFSAQIGYQYDRLDSEISRSFDRNRVYIGASASY